jgi:hypothetical protein
MLFKTLIDAIETQIKADNTANGLIAVYNRYIIMPGIHTMPTCIVGTSHSVNLSEEFQGESPISRPRLWTVSIGISCLTRNYPLQAQVITASENVDAVQAAVCGALAKDNTLGGAALQSWVSGISEIVLHNGEYRGFQITLELQIFEHSS